MAHREYRLTVFKRGPGGDIYGAKHYVNTLDVLLLWLVRRCGATWHTQCRELGPSHYRIGNIAELTRVR